MSFFPVSFFGLLFLSFESLLFFALFLFESFCFLFLLLFEFFLELLLDLFFFSLKLFGIDGVSFSFFDDNFLFFQGGLACFDFFFDLFDEDLFFFR